MSGFLQNFVTGALEEKTVSTFSSYFMQATSIRNHSIFLLFLVGAIVITNSILHWEASLHEVNFGDGISYYTIAEAAPLLPTQNHIEENLNLYLPIVLPDTSARGVFVAYDALPFHHAQRFTIPYITGILASLLPLSVHQAFYVLVYMLTGVLCYVLIRLSQSLAPSPFSLAQFMICTAICLCSPYVLRYPLAAPEMINELGFSVGLACSIYGLASIQRRWLFGGMFLAAVSKQTAILALMPCILWIMCDVPWKHKYSRKNRFIISFTAITIVGSIFMLNTGVTYCFPTFALPGNHLFDAVRILFSDEYDNKLALFAIFTARSILYYIPVLMLFIIGIINLYRTNKAPWSSLVKLLKDNPRIWFLLAFGPILWIQPFLGGPFIVGQNIARLTIYTLIPCCFAAGIFLQKLSLFTTRKSNVIALAFSLLCFISSLHPVVSQIDSFTGILYSNTQFALLFISLILIGSSILGWFSWKQLR